MEFEESIYNLIPKEAYVPPKAARHVSKHNPKCAPTASTFGLKTTSKPGASNMSGDVEAPTGHHTHKAGSGHFGLPKGAAKPDPSTFRLKNTGTMKLPDSKCLIHLCNYNSNGLIIKLRAIVLFVTFILLINLDSNYAGVPGRNPARKVPVPKRDEKPIMGLVSDKNFIVSNAVENILAAPKLPANQQKDYLKKKNYGKVPKYMQSIKKEIEDEYQLVREMQIEEEAEMDRQKFLMDEDEKQELIAALKKKWEVVHKEYQTLTHKQKLDTVGLKDRFENCERELKQLELDIQKLSKNYIFVDTTAPSTYF